MSARAPDHPPVAARTCGRRRALLDLLAVATSLVWTAPAAGDAPPRFIVIAHPGVPVVDQKFVADAFLKKITRWPSGDPIRAVDLRFDAPARASFSDLVLRRSVFAVRNYWQQRIFTGRGVPPPELESDDAVLRHVRTHPGAVGYVSASASISAVQVLTLR
jgi:hypothetical protein